MQIFILGLSIVVVCVAVFLIRLWWKHNHTPVEDTGVDVQQLVQELKEDKEPFTYRNGDIMPPTAEDQLHKDINGLYLPLFVGGTLSSRWQVEVPYTNGKLDEKVIPAHELNLGQPIWVIGPQGESLMAVSYMNSLVGRATLRNSEFEARAYWDKGYMERPMALRFRIAPGAWRLQDIRKLDGVWHSEDPTGFAFTQEVVESNKKWIKNNTVFGLETEILIHEMYVGFDGGSVPPPKNYKASEEYQVPLSGPPGIVTDFFEESDSSEETPVTMKEPDVIEPHKSEPKPPTSFDDFGRTM